MIDVNGLAVFETDIRPPWRRQHATPVVFHHGVGTTHEIWGDWVGALASERRLIRFDTRGCGSSQVPVADARWTMDGLVADLIKVIEYAAPAGGPVHLIGESAGGTVCLAAAIAHPDRVASLTVCNTAFQGSGINRVAGWRDEIEQEGIGRWADRMMDLRFAPGVISPRKAAWFAAEQKKSLPHVVLGLGEMLAATDLSGSISNITAPLLILMPDQSPFVPLEQAEQLAATVTGARLRVFEGVRHGLPFSHGRECALEAARFLGPVDSLEDDA